MFRWDPVVFIRFTLWLIAGILLSKLLGLQMPAPIWWLMGVAIAYTLLFLLIPSPQKRVWHPLFGLLAAVWLVVMGNYRAAEQLPEQRPLHFLHAQSAIKAYKAKLLNPLSEKANSFGALLSVEQIKTDKGWQHSCGKVQAYFAKDSGMALPQYRQWLLVKAAPQPIPPPANPGEFDYQGFLANKGIYHRQFLRQGTFVGLQADSSWSVQALAYQVQAYAVATFTRYIPTEEARAVALALVLGVKDRLDRDLRDAYAGTGAMHVLAVSGLHVGILLLLLQKLLYLFGKNAPNKPWAQGLVLLLLWCYAMVTGLAPSVLRATTMFSVVVLGRMLQRKGNIYNTLALSAFILLMVQPNLLFEVGFQLSYLAVFGIVYLQPRVFRVWQPRNRLLFRLWEGAAVAIAAQVATTPIGLYYFHQFPNYFLVSNLFVIYTAAANVYLGVGLLLLGWVPWVGTALGWAMNGLILLQNYLLENLVALPGAVARDLYISLPETWLLYALIGGWILLLALRQFRWVVAILCVMAVFAGSQLQRFGQMVDQQKLLVFSTGKQISIGMQQNGRFTLLAAPDLLRDEQAKGFHLAGYPLGRALQTEEVALKGGNRTGLPMRLLPSGNSLLLFQGKTMLLADKQSVAEASVHLADWLLLAVPQKDFPWEALAPQTTLILHPQMAFYKRQQLMEQARLHGVALHDLASQGAFIAEVD